MNLKKVFAIVGKLSKKEKTPVYAVGGFVRDFLLGEKKFKDIDFVVDGSGIAFAKELDNYFKNQAIKMDENSPVLLELEFAGARSEEYDKNSRKPKVQPTSLEQDLKRRDFTVNAMAMDAQNLPFSNHSTIKGRVKVIDPFGGQEDLKKKFLRTPLDPDKT